MSVHTMNPVYPSAYSLPWPPPSSKPGRTGYCINWATTVPHRYTYHYLELFITWVCSKLSPEDGCTEGQCTYITSIYLGTQQIGRSQHCWLNQFRKEAPVRLSLILLKEQAGPLNFPRLSLRLYPFILPWDPRYGRGQYPDPCLTSVLLAFLMKVLETPEAQHLLDTFTSSPSLQVPVCLFSIKTVLSVGWVSASCVIGFWIK